jgi:hypothetical protein
VPRVETRVETRVEIGDLCVDPLVLITPFHCHAAHESPCVAHALQQSLAELVFTLNSVLLE